MPMPRPATCGVNVVPRSAATIARNDGAAAAPDTGPAKSVFAAAVATPVPPLATATVPLAMLPAARFVTFAPLIAGNAPAAVVCTN